MCTPGENHTLIPNEFEEHKKIHLFSAPKIEISSTEVRKIISKGEDPENLYQKQSKIILQSTNFIVIIEFWFLLKIF